MSVGRLKGTIAKGASLTGEARIKCGSYTGEEYEGSYSITPTSTRQILQTNERVCLANIAIEPIPSNYGLITYDGTVITVS